MEKPSVGLWNKTKYYWKFFWNVIFKMLGNIWLITVPFMFSYRVFRIIGSKGLQSSISADTSKAIIVGLSFIFVFNLILLVHGVIIGNSLITIPENIDFYQEMWFIVKNTIPFNGLISLIKYIISL